MSRKRTCAISSSISFLTSAAIWVHVEIPDATILLIDSITNRTCPLMFHHTKTAFSIVKRPVFRLFHHLGVGRETNFEVHSSDRSAGTVHTEEALRRRPRGNGVILHRRSLLKMQRHKTAHYM